VEIEILASSTLFESGSSLAVEVLGRDAARYPGFRHRGTVNRGITRFTRAGGSIRFSWCRAFPDLKASPSFDRYLDLAIVQSFRKLPT
jgi:hypothetical protein